MPDIAVRLTAQGVADVINAMRMVREEAKATSTGGIGVLNQALTSMNALLPAVGAGLLVAKLAELGGKALSTAADMERLSERTGANVGTLSVLAMIAHDVGLETEVLSKGLTKFAKAQEDATNGNAKAKKAFTDLGIGLNDLKIKDPGALFVQTANKLTALGGGAHKTQIEIALFGKAGAELDPVLRITGNSFDEMRAKAQKLGLYLTKEGAMAAVQAKQAIKELGDVASGLATQFATGFAPQLTKGITMFADDIEGRGVDSVRKLGATVAQWVNQFLAGLLAIEHMGIFVWEKLENNFLGGFSKMQAAIQGFNAGGIAGMISNISLWNATDGLKIQAKNDSSWKTLQADLAKIKDAYNAPPPPTKIVPHDTNAGGSGDGTVGKTKDDSDKLASAQAAYQQALADNMLTIQKAANAVSEAEDKRRYAAGLTTVDEYYDSVKDRIVQSTTDELATLKIKYAAAAQLPETTDEQRYKRLMALAKIETQMAEVKLKADAQIDQASDAAASAREANAKKELEQEKTLATARGDRAQAELIQLKIEAAAYDDLLQKIGKLSDAERAAAVETYTAQARAKIAFGVNQQQGNEGVASLNEGVGALQESANNGNISQVEATAKILALEKERLVTLRQIGEQMTLDAELSGDPAAVAAADKYNASLDQMAAKLKNVTSIQTELTNQLTGQGYGDLVNFFDAGISGSKSFGSALADLGSQFEGIVSHMVSQLLVYYALMQLVGWIAPNSGFATSLAASGPFGKGFAGGGYTGNGATNAIAGAVHGQEFVFDAPTTRANRPLFEAIAAGQTPSLVTRASMAKSTTAYASQIAAHDAVNPPASGQVTLNVVDGSGQKATATQSKGPGGDSIINVVLGEVAKSIATNGTVGKTLSQTFGLSRQGVRRG